MTGLLSNNKIPFFIVEGGPSSYKPSFNHSSLTVANTSASFGVIGQSTTYFNVMFVWQLQNQYIYSEL